MSNTFKHFFVISYFLMFYLDSLRVYSLIKVDDAYMIYKFIEVIIVMYISLQIYITANLINTLKVILVSTAFFSYFFIEQLLIFLFVYGIGGDGFLETKGLIEGNANGLPLQMELFWKSSPKPAVNSLFVSMRDFI